MQLLILYMSRTNVFVSDCEEEEKRKKNEASFFLTNQRETNIIVSQLSKIYHFYTYLCLYIDTLWLIMMFNI